MYRLTIHRVLSRKKRWVDRLCWGGPTALLVTMFLARSVNAIPIISNESGFVYEYDALFMPVTAYPGYFTVGHYYQAVLAFRIQGLSAGEDFAGMNVDIVKTFSVSFPSGAFTVVETVDFGAGFYWPLGATYDSNGAAPGGLEPHWETNADPGNDLKGVQIFATAATAGNRQYGETPRPAGGSADLLGFPTAFGEVWYHVSSGNVCPIWPPPLFTVNSFQIWSNNTVNGGGTLVSIPEPRSIALLSILTLGACGRRGKRTDGSIDPNAHPALFRFSPATSPQD